MTPAVTIIGPGHPVFIIAEAGVNHNGDVGTAHKLIDAAVASRADAVKFQTFRAELLVSAAAPKAEYQRETTGGGNQLEMLRKLELPEAAWRELRDHANQAGIHFMSTPFDEESATMLSELGVPLLKLGSGDLTNRPLVEHCALTGLPLVISTGMANRHEVNAAVSWFRLAFQHGTVPQRESAVRFSDGGRIGLMHCVSSYPAPDAALNLRAIQTMQRVTKVPVGYSDHSEGIGIPPLAVAAGACMIEKHITLDRTLPGPDHRASLEPGEFTELVRRIRDTEIVLGHGRKEPHACEADVRNVARRSVVAVRDIVAGSLITPTDLGIRRPATGLAPSRLAHVIGSRALRAIPAGTPIQVEWLDLHEGSRDEHDRLPPAHPAKGAAEA